MDYQRKEELEDSYIEKNGRHPLWVYEREIKGKEIISYEDFLLRSTCGLSEFDLVEYNDGVITITYNQGEDQGKENENHNVDRFESFSNIDQALINKISEKLGRPAYSLYKEIRKFCTEEWKYSSKAFFEWLDDEMNYSAGKDLVQLDPSKPYGPDNCMLSGIKQELFRVLDEKHHTDFQLIYRKMRTGLDTSKLADEWKSLPAFLRWLQRNDSKLPDNTAIFRIDSAKPYGPDNCRFEDRNKLRSYNNKKMPKNDALISKVLCIGKKYDVNPLNKYKSLCHDNLIITSAWPLKDYLKWVIDQAENDEFAPYLNRLDQSRPYAPGNCYYSWRYKNMMTHGMTNTKLYRKYQYFVRYYRDKIKERATFEEFMDFVLAEKDYQLNSRMKVHADGEYVTLDDIEFISNDDDLADINRICSIYEAIPEKENKFDGLMDFMEWTIRQGYQSWMDFKKIGKGPYSKKTCVWDIFTEGGYIASKGRRTLNIFRSCGQ